MSVQAGKKQKVQRTPPAAYLKAKREALNARLQRAREIKKEKSRHNVPLADTSRHEAVAARIAKQALQGDIIDSSHQSRRKAAESARREIDSYGHWEDDRGTADLPVPQEAPVVSLVIDGYNWGEDGAQCPSAGPHYASSVPLASASPCSTASSIVPPEPGFRLSSVPTLSSSSSVASLYPGLGDLSPGLSNSCPLNIIQPFSTTGILGNGFQFWPSLGTPSGELSPTTEHSFAFGYVPSFPQPMRLDPRCQRL